MGQALDGSRMGMGAGFLARMYTLDKEAIKDQCVSLLALCMLGLLASKLHWRRALQV